jgi:hypothetical protein
MNVTAGGKRTEVLVTAAAYAALLVLGAVEGLIGSFQYSSWMAGPVPLAALACCAVLLATCLLGAWAMRSVSGAFAPAIGWIAAAFVLSIPVSNGSVIITNTAAGKWYLYGGTLCAAAAVALSLSRWFRAAGPRAPGAGPRARRAGPGAPGTGPRARRAGPGAPGAGPGTPGAR